MWTVLRFLHNTSTVCLQRVLPVCLQKRIQNSRNWCVNVSNCMTCQIRNIVTGYGKKNWMLYTLATLLFGQNTEPDGLLKICSNLSLTSKALQWSLPACVGIFVRLLWPFAVPESTAVWTESTAVCIESTAWWNSKPERWGDHRWFKRSTRKKRPVTRFDNTYNNNNNNNNNNFPY